MEEGIQECWQHDWFMEDEGMRAAKENVKGVGHVKGMR